MSVSGRRVRRVLVRTILGIITHGRNKFGAQADAVSNGPVSPSSVSDAPPTLIRKPNSICNCFGDLVDLSASVLERSQSLMDFMGGPTELYPFAGHCDRQVHLTRSCQTVGVRLVLNNAMFCRR